MSKSYNKGILGLAQELNRRSQAPTPSKKRFKAGPQPATRLAHTACYDYLEPIDMSLHNGVYRVPVSRPASFTKPSPVSEILNAGMEYGLESFSTPDPPADSPAEFTAPPATAKPAPPKVVSRPATNPDQPINDEAEEEQLRSKVGNPPAPPQWSPPTETPADSPAPSKLASPEKADDELDVDDFANDLREILSGQKRYDAGSKQVVDKNQESPLPSPPRHGRAPANSTSLGEDGHSVFDDLKQKFARAKTIDLGEMSLEKKFKAFDADLDQEEIEGPPLTDEETGQDLRDLGVPDRQERKSGISPGYLGRRITSDELEVGDIILTVSSADDTQARAELYTGNENLLPLSNQSAGNLADLLNRTHASAVLRPLGLSGLDTIEPPTPQGGSGRPLLIDDLAIHPSVCSGQEQADACQLYRGPIDFSTQAPVTSAWFSQAIGSVFDSLNHSLGTERPNQLAYWGHLNYPEN